jgi:hypothetical protein
MLKFSPKILSQGLRPNLIKHRVLTIADYESVDKKYK